MRAVRVVVSVVMVGALVLGACGDDDDGGDAAPGTTEREDSTSTSSGPTSTTTTRTGGDEPADDTTTTAAPAETSTTAPATATSTPDAPDGDLPTYETVSGPSGSGCSPGGAELPDGWWFGWMDGGPSATGGAFDLACFFVGDAAVEAAREDGDSVAIEEGYVPNDHWIRNQNPQLRDVTFDEAIEYRCVFADPDDATKQVPCRPGDVAGDFPVWLRVRGGSVDRLVEQFLP